MSVPSLKPSASLTSDGEFILNSSDMIDLQQFLYKAIALPPTKEAFENFYGINDDDFAKVTNLDGLIQVYSKINESATTFQKNTLPATIDIAKDVYNYAVQVPKTYSALKDTIIEWQNTTDPATAATLNTNVGTLLDDQINILSVPVDHTKGVMANLVQFKDDYIATKSNFDLIQQQVHQQFQGQHSVIMDYQNKVADWKNNLLAAQQEYQKSLQDSGGTITERVQNAKAAAAKFQAELQQYNQKLSAVIHWSAELTNKWTDLNPYSNTVSNVIDIVSALEGAWGALVSDLGNVKDSITNNIIAPDLIIKDLGVDQAISDWAKLKALAKEYLASAYVTNDDN